MDEEHEAGRGSTGRGPQQLDRRVVRAWQTGALLAVLPATVVLLVVGSMLGRLVDLPLLGVGASAAVLLTGGTLALLMPVAAHRRWRFELTEDALELRHGLVVHVHSAIPYHRVQHIDVQRGPVERLLGLSRLVVHTAAATSDAELPGLDAARADALRAALLTRAGVGDAV